MHFNRIVRNSHTFFCPRYFSLLHCLISRTALISRYPWRVAKIRNFQLVVNTLHSTVLYKSKCTVILLWSYYGAIRKFVFARVSINLTRFLSLRKINTFLYLSCKSVQHTLYSKRNHVIKHYGTQVENYRLQSLMIDTF